jgi:hypothetical protein
MVRVLLDAKLFRNNILVGIPVYLQSLIQAINEWVLGRKFNKFCTVGEEMFAKFFFEDGEREIQALG